MPCCGSANHLGIFQHLLNPVWMWKITYHRCTSAHVFPTICQNPFLALIVCGNWTPKGLWCQWASCNAGTPVPVILPLVVVPLACVSQISGHLHYIPLRNKQFWQACGWRVHTCNVRNVPHISTSAHIVSIGIKCTCEISPLDKRVLTIDILDATVSLTLLLLYVLLANSPGTPCTKLTTCSRIPPPLLADCQGCWNHLLGKRPRFKKLMRSIIHFHSKSVHLYYTLK